MNPEYNDRALETRDDFKDLTDILYTHELYYGSNTTILTGRGIIPNYSGIGEDYDMDYDIIINFNRPEDKQLFLTVIVNGNCCRSSPEFFENYFFTWYDNRDFEVATFNGKPITKESLARLVMFMKESGLQSSPKDLDKVIIKSDYCDSYAYKRKG